MTRVN